MHHCSKILDYISKVGIYEHLEKKAMVTRNQHRFTGSKFTGLTASPSLITLQSGKCGPVQGLCESLMVFFWIQLKNIGWMKYQVIVKQWSPESGGRYIFLGFPLCPPLLHILSVIWLMIQKEMLIKTSVDSIKLGYQN